MIKKTKTKRKKSAPRKAMKRPPVALETPATAVDTVPLIENVMTLSPEETLCEGDTISHWGERISDYQSPDGAGQAVQFPSQYTQAATYEDGVKVGFLFTVSIALIIGLLALVVTR